jgi:hypothetical protein
MRKLSITLGLSFVGFVLVYVGLLRTSLRAAAPATVPVQMTVSVEAKHGAEVPIIYPQDVRVWHDKNQLQITDWVPAKGDHAVLELFILLDDTLNPSVSLRFAELRNFIGNQPATTSIGIAYMQFGTIQIAQKLTTDHTLATKALRLPKGFGGISPSPYLSISDLTKSWPESKARREILVISSGVDLMGVDGLENPYVNEAIDRTQREGVQVYAIYASAYGHEGHSYWRMNWGQSYLAEVTEKTGGEFYGSGFQTAVSFKLYLDAFAARLNHQYEMTFLAVPENKAGYQRVKLETEVPNAELVAAERVYVPVER